MKFGLPFLSLLHLTTISPTLPHTPAGTQLAQWLSAFNSGNATLLAIYHNSSFPYSAASADVATPESELLLARGTGGFALRRLQESHELSLSVLLQEQHSPQFASVKIHVVATPPHVVESFEIHPTDTPDEFLTPEEREAHRMSAEKREAVLEDLSQCLKTWYISPELAARMVTALREKQEEGAYDNFTYAPDFARVLTKDMRAVSHDLHLRIIFGRHPEPGDPPPSKDKILEMLRAMRFGFGRAEWLDGGIAVFPILGFVPSDLPEAKDAISEIMAEVADAAALVLDLRKNGGGHPATVSWVSGFLFGDEKVHLNDIYCPHDDRTEEYWTQPPAPETRFGLYKPLYVLVSNTTISGGEELPYDLQALGRATIVGETTAGAAHLPRVCEIDKWWVGLVPSAYAINPVTGRNWEAVGVEPDIKVMAGKALKEAVRRAREELGLPPEGGENEKGAEGRKLTQRPLDEKQHVLGET